MKLNELTKKYLEMYAEAKAKTSGYHNGYTGINALSCWVNETYGVNSESNNVAHDALIEIFHEIHEKSIIIGSDENNTRCATVASIN